MLFVSLAAAYSAEHSGRTTLCSLASCMSPFPLEWVDLLGWWGGNSSEAYARAQRFLALIMQTSVAERVRGGDEVANAFDEAALMCDLERFLREMGVPDTWIIAQICGLSAGVVMPALLSPSLPASPKNSDCHAPV